MDSMEGIVRDGRLRAGARRSWRVACSLGVLAAAISVFTGSSVAGLPVNQFSTSVEGTIAAVSVGSDKIFVGGDFSYVGPYDGAGAEVSLATGTRAASPDFLDANGGQLYASVRDGNGGWYVGGAFNSVNAQSRTNLAHVNPDGSVDTSFPTATGAVWSLHRIGTTLYVGGDFLNIGGLPRTRLAAIDTTTNTVTSWNPAAPASTVKTIDSNGSLLYIGGSFGTVGGTVRGRVAAIDTTTGVLDPTFNPNANNEVAQLIVNSGLVYLAGRFTTIGGGSARRLARVNATTGALDAGWNPSSVGSDVYSIAINGTSIYVGGSFSNMGGQPRSNIAQICMVANCDGSGTASGSATSWNPGASSWVNALNVSGSTLYVGGNFTTLGAQSVSYIGSFDTGTGSLTSWRPGASKYVRTISTDSTSAFIGGDFALMNATARTSLAALNFDGSLSSWNPPAGPGPTGITPPIRALYATGSTLYVGGSFSWIGGQSRNKLAALDTNTAAVGAWNPNASSMVETLASDGTNLFVGGSFTTISATARNRLAAYDLATQSLTGFDPNLSGTSMDLAVNGSTLYVGGLFTTVNGGGIGRSRLAAFCITANCDGVGTPLGTATAWNPNANNTVNNISIDDQSLYATGAFTTLGGLNHRGLGEIELSSGTPTSWASAYNLTSLTSLLAHGGIVYIGNTSSMNFGGGIIRWGVAALDQNTADVIIDWDPAGSSSADAIDVDAMTVFNEKLLALGDWTIAGNVAGNGIGLFDLANPIQAIPSNISPPHVSGTGEIGTDLTCSTGTWTDSPTSYAYTWKNEGTTIAGETSSTYTVRANTGVDPNGDYNENISCSVVATNAAGSSSPVDSDNNIKGWQVPENTVIPAITGSTIVGNTLTCSSGTWLYSPTGYTYQWYRGATPIGAAGSSTYSTVAEDIGASITCRVTAGNQYGAGVATSNPVTISSNSSLTPPHVTGTGEIGTDLSCSDGTWTGVPLTYSYAWKNDGTTIPLATSSTYTVRPGDFRNDISCTVSASYVFDVAGPVDSDNVINGWHVPDNTVIPAISGATTVGNTLTCSAGTWLYLPTGYSRQWYRGISPIAGATGAIYNTITSDIGSQVRCEVVATNEFGDSSPVLTDPVTITVDGSEDGSPPSTDPGSTPSSPPAVEDDCLKPQAPPLPSLTHWFDASDELVQQDRRAGGLLKLRALGPIGGWILRSRSNEQFELQIKNRSTLNDPIRHVDFYIDEDRVGTDTVQRFLININPKEIAVGYHVLKSVAISQSGKSYELSLPFQTYNCQKWAFSVRMYTTVKGGATDIDMMVQTAGQKIKTLDLDVSKTFVRKENADRQRTIGSLVLAGPNGSTSNDLILRPRKRKISTSKTKAKISGTLKKVRSGARLHFNDLSAHNAYQAKARLDGRKKRDLFAPRSCSIKHRFTAKVTTTDGETVKLTRYRKPCKVKPRIGFNS